MKKRASKVRHVEVKSSDSGSDNEDTAWPVFSIKDKNHKAIRIQVNIGNGNKPLKME